MSKLNGAGCGCYVIILACQAAIGWLLSDWFFQLWFGKDLPFIVDFIVGLCFGSVILALDVLGWVMSYFMPTPIWMSLVG